MLKEIRPAIVMLLLLSVITGLVYPYVVTGAAHVLFPHQAAGSLIEKDGKVIGSELIGQNFADEKYFHGRLSAIGVVADGRPQKYFGSEKFWPMSDEPTVLPSCTIRLPAAWCGNAALATPVTASG